MVSNILSINDLRLWIYLGHSDEEKCHKQSVALDVQIEFNKILTAVHTDLLQDSVCYEGMATLIHNLLAEKRFNLIEHLAYYVHQNIKSHLTQKKHKNVSVKVKVTKTSTPVVNIHGGVSFYYSD